jgi:hypothetical protein
MGKKGKKGKGKSHAMYGTGAWGKSSATKRKNGV